VASAEPFAIRFPKTGGPEVLQCEPLDLGEPGPGEVLIRHEAIGLNFIDTYVRGGLYPAQLPSGLGNEAAGVIESIGPDVTDFLPGDRVGYFTSPPGAYATHRIIPARLLVKLPDAISFEQAAAAMLKGCTAEFLIERCSRVQPGQTVLVHAAAGGVGSIAVQWLKAIGASVIAHSGNAAKAALAIELGADVSLDVPMEALAERVRQLTDGNGVPVVLDGVGAASWEASLASAARRGLVVSYGNASGPVPPFSMLELSRRGSLFVTRPTLFDYCATPEDIGASAARLFEMIGSGKVDVRIGTRFPLADAADAHRALEGRLTTGSTVLIP
jgi:NADPH2:quinone reductase